MVLLFIYFKSICNLLVNEDFILMDLHKWNYLFWWNNLFLVKSGECLL